MNSLSRKPRILFVGAFPPADRPIYGGIVSSCASLLASELPQRVEFSLLDSTQISNPPPIFLIRLGLAARRFLDFCVRVVRKRPDAVLIFMSDGASIVEKGLMGWFARAWNVPVLLFPRAGSVMDASSRSSTLRVALRFFLRSATVLLCQSETWKRFACSQLGIPANRTQVIENWTACPEFLAVGARRSAMSTPKGIFRITFVGWVEREKGIFDLLKACSSLRDTSDFVLQIVGDGSARSAAESLAREERIAGRVKFLGWLSSSSLCEVLEQSDAFVLPSWAEGFPNAMIEAMATRLPVVVSRVGGIPDIIRDRVSGLLVQPRSPNELKDALRCLIDRDDIRRSVADAAYGLARDRFSRSAAVEKFQRAFDLALRQAAPQQPKRVDEQN